MFRFVPQSIVIHTGSYKQRNETEQTFATRKRTTQTICCSPAEETYVTPENLKIFLDLRAFQDNFCSYEMGQSVGGAITGESREKTHANTHASRTWLVSHLANAGLEPTPDTAVR